MSRALLGKGRTATIGDGGYVVEGRYADCLPGRRIAEIRVVFFDAARENEITKSNRNRSTARTTEHDRSLRVFALSCFRDPLALLIALRAAGALAKPVADAGMIQ